MKRCTSFVYPFRHFNLTPVRNLICTSALQLAPVLLHLPVCVQPHTKKTLSKKRRCAVGKHTKVMICRAVTAYLRRCVRMFSHASVQLIESLIYLSRHISILGFEII